MKLEIAISSDEGEPRPSFVLNEDVLVPWLSAMLDEVWPDWRERSSVSVSVATVGEDEMKNLNSSYRNCDAPTDVLSFPNWEEDGRFSPPDWSDVPLGDVVVCPSVVERNAREHGVSFDSEMALMVFHSVLHLVGYDHDREDREREMWSIQERFRDLLLADLKPAFPTGQEG